METGEASTELLSDAKLEQSINRHKRNYELIASRLPERGQLIKETIRSLEQEKERRERSRRPVKDGGGGQTSPQSQSSNEQEGVNDGKRRLPDDRKKLLDSQANGEPLSPVVSKDAGDKSPSAMEYSSNSQPNIELGNKPQTGMQNGDSKQIIVELMTDLELQNSIRRQKRMYDMMASRLPDKGKRIKDTIKILEQEKECRERSLLKDDSRGEIPVQSQSLNVPEESEKRTRLLDIDRNKLPESQVDGESLSFVATKAAGDKPHLAMENSNNSQPNIEIGDKPQLDMQNGDSNWTKLEFLAHLELEESIGWHHRNDEVTASRMPGRGEKIKVTSFEHEKECREWSLQKVDSGREMPTQSQSPSAQEESNKKRKRQLDIDGNKLMNSQEEGEPSSPVVSKAAGDKSPPAMENSNNCQPNIELGSKPQTSMQNGDSKQIIPEFMTDLELRNSISRQKRIYDMMASRLPDGGEKIKDMIKSLEQEKECRERSLRKVMDDSTGKIPAQSQSLTVPEGNEKKRTKLLYIDRNKLPDSQVDRESPSFMATKAAGDKPQSAMENRNYSQPHIEMGDKPQLDMQNGDTNQTKLEFVTHLELEESIGLHHRNYEVIASRLPDTREKVKATSLEQEKECREWSLQKDDSGREMPTQSQSSSVQEESNHKRKSLLDIDAKLLNNQEDGEPSSLVVSTDSTDKPQSATETGNRNRANIELGDKPLLGMENGDSNGSNLEFLTDLKLEKCIARHKRNFETMANRLPDKGKKIMNTIKRFEQEKERRERSRCTLKDNSRGEMLIQSQISSLQGKSDKKGKGLLVIDRNKLLNSQEDGEPLSLVATIAATDKVQSAMEIWDHNRANTEFRNKPQLRMENGDDDCSNLEFLTDLKLEQSIARHKQIFETIANRFPDNGQKIMYTINRLEQEKELLERSRGMSKDNTREEMLIQSQSSSVQEESDNKRKRLLDVDRNKLLNSRVDDEPPSLVATKAAGRPQSIIETGNNQANIEFGNKPQVGMVNGNNRANSEFLTDLKLEQSIAQQKQIFETIANRFPDRGQKIMHTIRSLEQEKELLAKNRGMTKDNCRGEMLTQCQSSRVQDESDNRRKRLLDIDRNKLLNSQEDRDPLSLVSTEAAAGEPQLTMEAGGHNRANIVFHNKQKYVTENWDDNRENVEFLTDLKLEQSIARHKHIFETMANRTPDRGQKIMDKIKCLEQEKELLERNRRMVKEKEGWDRSTKAVKDMGMD